MENIVEKLTDKDPIEKWISDFISSDNPRFDGKSKEERIKMAIGAYYGSKNKSESIHEKRETKIFSLALAEDNEDIVKLFVEMSEYDSENFNILDLREDYKTFKYNLFESNISIGSKASVECIKPWGPCKVGDKFSGIWKQAAWPHQLRLDLQDLPRGAIHPIIFYNKKNNKPEVQSNFKLL